MAAALNAQLARAIRARRMALEFSQAELAVRSGLSLSYLNLVERGDRSLGLDSLIRLARGLETSAGRIITDVVEPGRRRGDYPRPAPALEFPAGQDVAVRRRTTSRHVDAQATRLVLLQTFAEIIRARRSAIGISQDELARRSGLHRTHVSLLERALRSPYFETIVLLGRGLNTKPSRLVDPIGKGMLNRLYPPVPTRQELSSLITSPYTAERERINAVIDECYVSPEDEEAAERLAISAEART